MPVGMSDALALTAAAARFEVRPVRAAQVEARMTRTQTAEWGDAEWRAVSARAPCPICGSEDGCQVHEEDEFASCQKVPSIWPLTNGTWLHRTVDVPFFDVALDESPTVRLFPVDAWNERVWNPANDAQGAHDSNGRAPSGVSLLGEGARESGESRFDESFEGPGFVSAETRRERDAGSFEESNRVGLRSTA